MRFPGESVIWFHGLMGHQIGCWLGLSVITSEHMSSCERVYVAQADIPVYNYSVPGFYGFRGEYPGRQQFDRSDFSGCASQGSSVGI